MWKKVAIAAGLLAGSGALAGDTPRVTFGALGDLRAGMSEREVGRVAGGRVVHIAPEAEEDGCFYASVRGLPKSASLMFVSGRLARIDVFQRGVLTASGVGVGTSEAQLKRTYGAKLRQEPHAYTGPEGHYFTLYSPDGKLGVRFETDGARVTGYYSGTSEAIQYIEGCQ